MIRKPAQMKRATREAMRGGRGTIEFLHYFEKDELRSPARLLAKLTIHPGDSIGLHRHEDEEEVFIVLRGEGEIFDGERRERVEAGDAILTGSGEEHAVENTGTEDLEVVAVIVRFPS